ncbi:MAG TPA: primosomal protein N' [Candidatus Saccharimonadales bacterium]|nr:primosomal protein N' [Candidatus Saccharimonadales bacterium]
MYYYEVWPRSQAYHGQEALTYHSPQKLDEGRIVKVPLQRQEVLALVVKAANKPTFATKPINQSYNLPAVPPQLIKLGQWLKAYYPAPLGMIAQQFLPAAIKDSGEFDSKATSSPNPSHLPSLTPDQAKVLRQITKPDTYLLHGKTGSGKTRIYIELALRAFKQTRSAIILTPEISLTSQLAEQFRLTFGKQVIVLHSKLTPKERLQAWQTILKATGPLVVIGPRSALFSPLQNVGLIVIDEAHEPAYKQEQAPHYHASRVASKLAEIHGATLVLGSATPLVSDYFMAQQRQKTILKLDSLATVSEHPPTKVTVVDLKDRSLFPRTAYLSLPLIKAIERALKNHQQTLLYLNRRGTARLVLCENCGWQATCPHCDLPLTYHGDSHQLRCHICNFHEPTPSSCPNCGHPTIIFKAVGTKAIVQEVQRLFPGAKVQRFDTDNKKADSFEQHYSAVHSGEVDILVGTQLLAKGLDLPRLSVLGILIADTSLQMPDYSAQERTYQLLCQVLGRVGRGHVAGEAIVQSYQPDHPIIQAALSDDWQSFYKSELESRRKFSFPPFCHLLQLTVRRANPKSAQKAAADLAENIKKAGLKVKIEGPAPAFHEKFQAKYQWQLVIKARERSELLKVIQLLPTNTWSYNIDPVDLL